MLGAAAAAAVWRLLLALGEEHAAGARPHAGLATEALTRGLVKALARLVAAGAPAFGATVLLLLGGRDWAWPAWWKWWGAATTGPLRWTGWAWGAW